MPSDSRSSNRLFSLLLGALLFLAPIARGGAREVALTALLAIGLALLATLCACRSFSWLSPSDRRPGAHSPALCPMLRPWQLVLIGIVAGSPVWIGLLQLVPVGADLWSTLAGRGDYLPALRAAGLPAPKSLPLTLTPIATWASIWSAVPLTAVFLAALAMDDRNIERLCGVLILTGVVQVLIAIAQFAGGPKSIFYFDAAAGGTFIGTFANRNHLADLMAMLIPVWFYFLLRQQKAARSSQEASTWFERPAVRPLWLFLGFSFLVIVLSTQSRGGLLTSTAVLVLSTSFYLLSMRSQVGTRQRVVLIVLLAVFALAALVSIGLEGVASRLQRTTLEADSDVREAYALTTFEAAKQFWPWGSGLGSFESVFPRFQELQSLGFVNQAHNDYPQLLLEAGAPGLIVALCAAVLFMHQAWKLYRRYRRAHQLTADMSLRVFAGLGVLALLLHSWVEYNMHIPALALTATFLAGVYLRPLAATRN